MKTAAKQDLLAKFLLRPCQWDATAAAWSRLLPHDSPEFYGNLLSKLVKEGTAAAYELTGPDGRIAIMVASINREYAEPKLTIWAAISPDNNRTLTEDFLPQIEAKARELGCRTVAFHTMRPGLLEKAMRLGYRTCEVICRKDVNP